MTPIIAFLIRNHIRLEIKKESKKLTTQQTLGSYITSRVKSLLFQNNREPFLHRRLGITLLQCVCDELNCVLYKLILPVFCVLRKMHEEDSISNHIILFIHDFVYCVTCMRRIQTIFIFFISQKILLKRKQLNQNTNYICSILVT